LQGSCQVNDTVELPALKVSKQVKSMQMFKRPVTSVTRGDRAALCVTQLNAKLLERGLAAAPGTVPTFAAAVAAVDKVRFYNGAVPGKAKYHMSIGHATVMAEATFFGLPDTPGSSQAGVWRCVDLYHCGWWVRLCICVCCRGLLLCLQSMLKEICSQDG
jgi:selenocysteine-specific elongation factor